jgi:dihydroorotase-like cyclic amidohydrolase
MRTVITGGRVWAGDGERLHGADVLVENGVIADVGTGLDGDVALDVEGRALLPGFIAATSMWP